LKLGRDKAGPAAPEAYVAAFGKHPGWDDHIEDIGIETDHLASLKQLLYVQGIGGTIDSGAWDSLEEGQRVERFAHVFVRRAGGDLAVGKLWSSADGKGRARYPMVVCAQLRGVPLDWAVCEVLPRLEDVRQRCIATDQAAEVVQIIDDARRQLRERVADAETGGPELVVPPRNLAGLADCDETGEGHGGMLRIMYQVRREMSAHLRGADRGGRADEARPVQIRLPTCGPTPEQTVVQWLQFMLSQVREDAEVWAILSLERPWIDVFVGTPTPQQFFCFQASREALPLASEIPYTLDDDFVREAESLIDASRQGQADRIVIHPGTPRAPKRAGLSAADLRAKLRDAWQSSSVRWSLVVVLAAVLAAAVLMAAVRYWPESTPPPPPKPGNGAMAPADLTAWDALCTHLTGWFDRLTEEADQRRLKRWEADDHLAAEVVPVLRDVLDEKIRVDPREFTGAVGARLDRLVGNPPPGARTPEVIAKTRQALRTVRQVEQALKGGRWPALRQLTTLADDYKKRGWLAQADYLASVAAGVRPGRQLAGSVDRALTASAKVKDLEARWQQVRRNTAVLSGAGSPVLAKFSQYVDVETRGGGGAGSEADLDAMAMRLGDVGDLAGQLADYVRGPWRRDVDKVLVQEDPPVAAPTSAEQLKGGAVFRSWHLAVQLPKYRKLDPALDPRTAAWKQKQQDVFKTIAGNIDELKKAGYKKTGPFDVGLTALRDEFKALCDKRWDQRRRTDIERGVLALADGPTPLRDKISDALSEVGETIEKFLESQRPPIARSRAVNDHWAKKLAELEKLVDAKKIRDLTSLRTKVGRLKKELKQIDGDLRGAIVSAAVRPDRRWNSTLAGDVLLARREEALAAALAAMGWKDGLLVLGPKFETKWRREQVAFAQWRSDLEKLIAAFNQIEDALDAAALPDEKLAPDGESAARLYAPWAKHAIAAEPRVAEVLKPLVDRLAHLRNVAKSTDRAKLADAARTEGGRGGAARAAWIRLGRLEPPWPGNAKEFEQERRIQADLAAAYALIRPPQRQQQLRKELADGAGRRWEAYFVSRTEAAEIRKAVERMADFGVDAARQGALGPFARFRLALHDFRGAALAEGAGGDDRLVKKRIAAFQAKVLALPGGLAGRPPISAFLAELARIAAAEDTGADFAKAGPGTVGWQPNASDDDARTRYTTTLAGRRHVLEFVLVAPAGKKPSFLCTTEVSVGLLADTVAAAGKAAEMLKLLKAGRPAEDEPRYGPQTWAAAGKAIQPAKAWLRPPGGVSIDLLYPKGGRPAPPTRDAPMQQLSPAAAGWFARLLGCRLPAAAEWSAAWEAHEKDHSGARPNLRDAAWQAQQTHIKKHVVEGGKFAEAEDYYADAGIFWPKGAADRKEGGDAPAGSGSDGVLWFSAVASGKPRLLYHLVGNVAEWVYDDPAGLSQCGAAEVERLFRQTPTKLAVIGGSALSAPSVRPDKPQPIDYGDASLGYSDVGFRLAFTAPAESVGARLRRLLNARGYLTLPAAAAK